MYKKKFHYSTKNLHELMTLTVSLDYTLRKAEEIKKKIGGIKLKLKINN